MSDIYDDQEREWYEDKIEELEAENQKLKKQMVFLLKWIKNHLKYMNIDYASFKRSFENELKVLEDKDE